MNYTTTYRIGYYVWDEESGDHKYIMDELSYDKETAQKRYDSLTPTDDRPQIEMWEEIRRTDDGSLEDREKTAMKDSTVEYPWWEF